MKTTAKFLIAAALCSFLSACSHDVNEADEDLNVPDVTATQAALPLRVAVYVAPDMVKTAERYVHNPLTGWLRAGDLGPKMLYAAELYTPYFFQNAYLAPRFPNPVITSSKVDAVIVVEDILPDSHIVDPMNEHGSMHIDAKLTLGVYTATGDLITRYTSTATVTIPSDNWNGGGNLQSVANYVANAGSAEPPAFRKALFQFPQDQVRSYLTAHQQDIAAEEKSATPDDWAAKKAAIDGLIAKCACLANHPDAEGLVENNRKLNEVAGVAAAIGTAAVAGLAAQGINPGFNMAVVNFENQVMADNPTFVNATQFIDSTAALIPLKKGVLPQQS